ncbi:MAG: hypothetical protein KDA96_26865, partial [Planctomycetaceae bacterium]|nr:hypothetical protein [Planctomycetaceae bacterium]
AGNCTKNATPNDRMPPADAQIQRGRDRLSAVRYSPTLRSGLVPFHRDHPHHTGITRIMSVAA